LGSAACTAASCAAGMGDVIGVAACAVVRVEAAEAREVSSPEGAEQAPATRALAVSRFFH
jgi:hypothetical protein